MFGDSEGGGSRSENAKGKLAATSSWTSPVNLRFTAATRELRGQPLPWGRDKVDVLRAEVA